MNYHITAAAHNPQEGDNFVIDALNAMYNYDASDDAFDADEE